MSELVFLGEEPSAEIVPLYQKVGGSRAIGPNLNPDNRHSNSFAVFVSGIRKLTSSKARKA